MIVKKDIVPAELQERYTQYAYLLREIENQYNRQLKSQMQMMELIALNNMLEADKLLLQACRSGQPPNIIQEIRQLATDTCKTWQQLREMNKPTIGTKEELKRSGKEKTNIQHDL